MILLKVIKYRKKKKYGKGMKYLNNRHQNLMQENNSLKFKLKIFLN